MVRKACGGVPGGVVGLLLERKYLWERGRMYVYVYRCVLMYGCLRMGVCVCVYLVDMYEWRYV